jgi:excinuclease ABC subunit C
MPEAAPAPPASADPKARLKEKLRHLPHRPGVYLMKDRFGAILYVGKAKDLKKRVSTYFRRGHRVQFQQPKVAAMLPLIWDLDIVEVRSETEAILLEGKLIKDFKPRYNTDFTDDKRFLLVRLDEREPFPRFRLARLRRDDGARYFGPFANGGLLRRALAEMRRQFGILLGDAPQPTPLAGDVGRFRLYDDARAEIYSHPNEITSAEYAERVRAALVFLEGKARTWLADLREKMHAAAEARQYERAAALRDCVQALEQTHANATRDRRFLRGDPMKAAHTSEAARQLAEAAGLPAPPRVLECFDISHISGVFVVAALVRFVDSKPDKAGYRLFRIRSPIGNDDFRAMEEVVGRRYRRLQKENKAPPDLIVIDGGKGQVHAALKAFLLHELTPPPLIGLAKREETIVFPDKRPDVRLPAHSPALRLIQHLRDEAHRFANTYNAKLRSKKIRESVLDDFSGLGPVRKAALLDKFKTLTRLRAATVEELRETPGVGPMLAVRLRDFLDKRGEKTAG